MNSTEESVYHLLSQIPQPSWSPSIRSNSLYRSIFASNVVRERSRNTYPCRTMGPPLVSKPDPAHPLRRRQNYVALPEVVPLIRPHRLPPIPKVDQQNRHSVKPHKNFVRENITRISNALPTCPVRYIVSDRKGNKFLIDGSGLQKDFIHKKNYGKIPWYLRTRLLCDQPSFDSTPENTTMVLLPVEERLCLIQNLKHRYEDVFAEYQRLPLRPETTSALSRKTYLTEELVSLERDIGLLEKHQQIFIVNNYSEIQK